MEVEVNIDVSKFKRLMDKASDLAISAVAEQMLVDSTDYVPYSNGSRQSAGALRESGRIEKGQETGTRYLIWDTVYALYQWFGVRADGTHVVKNYSTPGTTKEWVLHAKNIYGDDWVAIAQREVNKVMR